MRIFIFGRVVLPDLARRIVADKRLGRRRAASDFCLIFAPLRATMNKKSSVPQAISFVSQVLKRDN